MKKTKDRDALSDIVGYYPIVGAPALAERDSGPDPGPAKLWPLSGGDYNPPPLVTPTRSCRSFLCFDTPIVNAGGTRVLTAQPDIDFRPRRLAVAPSIAKHFRIRDLRVGYVSQRVNGESGASAELFPPLPFDKREELFPPLPFDKREEHERRRAAFFGKQEGVSAELFPALPTTDEERKILDGFVALDFPVCSVSQFMSILVENTSKTEARFEAIVWGVFAG